MLPYILCPCPCLRPVPPSTPHPFHRPPYQPLSLVSAPHNAILHCLVDPSLTCCQRLIIRQLQILHTCLIQTHVQQLQVMCILVWFNTGSKNPFIFNPYASKEERAGATPSLGPAEWVCGETASVDIHIQNPTAVMLRVHLYTSSYPWFCMSYSVHHAAAAAAAAAAAKVYRQLLQPAAAVGNGG